MISQILLLVDRRDNLLGYASRRECHAGRGKRHRAFVTLLFDNQKRVILQRRKHKLFDGFWDLTAISHALHIDGRDETYQEASDRALKKEMGIGHVEVEQVGAFNYFARDGENCENEYCAVLVGHYDGAFEPNKDEVYEVKKVAFEKFLADIKKNAADYTPWARLAAKQLANSSRLTVHSSQPLKKELESFLRVFEPYEKRYFAEKIKAAADYPRVIADAWRNLAYFSQGGKKMRAFLVWLGYRVSQSRKSKSKVVVQKILPISLAFEMTQSFLLIHDDVIDQSLLRRGKPTIHNLYAKKFGRHYGESMAIVLGDGAAVELFDLVNSSTFGDNLKILCQRELSRILLETIYGQVLDIEYSFRAGQTSFKEVSMIAELKTARYSFVGPLKIGAMLAGATQLTIKALSEFGQAVGIAFQLQDDILGVFGDEKILGKPVLSDMREGKNTVLIHKAKEMANSADKRTLSKLWGKSNAESSDLVKIKTIIKRSGALAWSEGKMQKLVESAKRRIKKITPDGELQIIFSQLADFAVSRQK